MARRYQAYHKSAPGGYTSGLRYRFMLIAVQLQYGLHKPFRVSFQNLPHPMFRCPCFCGAARGSMLAGQGSSKGRSVSAHIYFLAGALSGLRDTYFLCHVWLLRGYCLCCDWCVV